jgi:hypothetical protein
VDDAVRVKAGTTDSDFPDIPLGGWSGRVEDVDASESPPMYLVEWNDFTLTHMHPVYQVRCDRDDLDWHTCWLTEAELEPADDTPAAMEQPTKITPRPLRLNAPEDRIRKIFGLTSDDQIPAVDHEHVTLYQAYLSQELSFPFQAEAWEGPSPLEGRVRTVTVMRLAAVEANDWQDGILAEGSVDGETVVLPLAQVVSPRSASRRLLQDYCFWFYEWAAGPPDDFFGPGAPEGPATLGEIVKTVLRWSVYGMGLGAVLGAILATLDGALYGLYVGGGILALLGVLLGSYQGRMFGLRNRNGVGSVSGGVAGLLIGAIVGSGLGILLVAGLGSVPGAVAASLLGGYLRRLKVRPIEEPLWALLGGCLGGLAVALYHNRDQAVGGALTGAVIGGAGCFVLYLVVIVVLGLASYGKEGEDQG